jgi:hypothetical protein
MHRNLLFFTLYVCINTQREHIHRETYVCIHAHREHTHRHRWTHRHLLFTLSIAYVQALICNALIHAHIHRNALIHAHIPTMSVR